MKTFALILLMCLVATPVFGGTVRYIQDAAFDKSAEISLDLTVGGTTHFNAIDYNWPSVEGAADTLLSTDGGGGLSWVAAGAGDITDVWDCSTGNCQALTAGSSDTIDATSASSTIPWKVNDTASPTTEGQVIWDSNDDILTIGDGAGTDYVAYGASDGAALAGDSATAFFDAGTIEHEYGGLQADLSSYTGLIGISGVDTTVEVDTESELETALGGADVVVVASNDITSANLATLVSNETGTGVVVFDTDPTFSKDVTVTGDLTVGSSIFVSAGSKIVLDNDASQSYIVEDGTTGYIHFYKDGTEYMRFE